MNPIHGNYVTETGGDSDLRCNCEGKLILLLLSSRRSSKLPVNFPDAVTTVT